MVRNIGIEKKKKEKRYLIFRKSKRKCEMGDEIIKIKKEREKYMKFLYLSFRKRNTEINIFR